MAGSKSSRPAEHADLLLTTLRRFLVSRLRANDRLCVALSGGRDSVALLHALIALRDAGAESFPLSAIHVHHGLSPNADSWAAFCAGICEHWSVPLRVVRVEVPRDSGEGLEGAARRLRHAAFAECEADYLLLAHHREDQAETVLLNLLRGSGVAGAAGMLAERPQPRGPVLLRPLLDMPRTHIEDYAERHALRWIDDESNDNLHFRRNYLRRAVMPQLAEHFPGAQAALARAAGYFAEASVLLEELAAEDFAFCRAPSGRLHPGLMNKLSRARARNLLRFAWVSSGFRAPDSRWLDEALRQLSGATRESAIHLSTPEGDLRVYRDELYMLPVFSGHHFAEQVWAGEAVLPWNGGQVRFESVTGAGIDAGRFQAARAVLRLRQGGERLQSGVKRPRRMLRNLLQELAIPPWERKLLPCLWLDGRLAWVGGVGVDAAFYCPPDQAGLMPVWQSGSMQA